MAGPLSSVLGFENPAFAVTVVLWHHSYWSVMKSKSNVIYISLVAKNLEYSFKYLLTICISSFRKYLFSSLAHLLIRWFGLWRVLNRHLSHLSWVWNRTSHIWMFNFLRYLWILDNQMHTWKRLFSLSVGSLYSGGWFLCYTKCFFNLM